MISTKVPEYSILAEVYDTVMEDVDYEVWADFIDEVIQRHHPHPQNILELACGTGSLSLALDKLDCYQITGTDKSVEMIEKACEKTAIFDSSIDFIQMDILDIHLHDSFDIIVAVFDSINYLQTKNEIHRMIVEVKKVMKPHSLFIFDFTTPKNSIESIQYLNDKDGSASNGYRFFRKSSYDDELQIHYNTFEIEKLADDENTVLKRFTEQHRQRAYSLKQMQDIISETDFKIRAQYGEFDLDEATDKSLRITMVLECPDTQL